MSAVDAAVLRASLPELRRRWVVRSVPSIDERTLDSFRELGLPTALVNLLHVRGHSPDTARAFLKPRLDQLHDPLLLPDITCAVDRIRRAIAARERILVHGDYDVDGISAAALYTRVLRTLGAEVVPFVPHRMTDGYDLGPAGIRRAIETGASLILTGDCGTVAHDAIAQAALHDIDVIVTDHHTPGDTLPAAVAVVNPNRSDSNYPFRGLAGAGVAWKLCHALAAELGGDADSLRWHLDLVALATIADLAPLTDENRVFARFGLRVLEQTRNTGLRALLSRTSTTNVLTAGQVSHVLAPRLNAVGRMGAASRALELLLTDEPTEAAAIADELEAQNRIRQDTDRAILDDAIRMLEESYDETKQYGIVLSSPDWHPGVIGIVASRVVERVHRPVVLIAEDPATGRGRGSARSIPAFDLYRGIHACAEHLDRYGGHRQAAGMDLRLDRIDAFRESFNDHALEMLDRDDLMPEVRIDLEVTLADANDELCRLMRHCGPFGIGNPQPVLVVRGVETRYCREVGDGEHIRMVLVQDGARMPAIGFRMARRFRELETNGRIDVAFHLQHDEWQGRLRLQARLIDVQSTE